MGFDLNGSNSYSVEVSGWDAKENFFVEKTVLDWDAGGRREVGLQSKVRPGAVVFVRLLRPLVSDSDFPIAYEAVKVDGKMPDGRTRISLMRLAPANRPHDAAPGVRRAN